MKDDVMKDLDSTVWFDRRDLIKGAVAGAGALALPGRTRRRMRRARAARCGSPCPTIRRRSTR